MKKTYTIGRRGEFRDYFDLYIILKGEYINLNELMKIAKDIYTSAFDEKIFLEQLVYFEDLTNFEIIPPSDKPVSSKEDIKQYFEELVKDYVAQ